MWRAQRPGARWSRWSHCASSRGTTASSQRPDCNPKRVVERTKCMRVELTAGERAQLRELSVERSLGERSGFVRPELATRWRQLQDTIARAHGVHPARSEEH